VAGENSVKKTNGQAVSWFGRQDSHFHLEPAIKIGGPLVVAEAGSGCVGTTSTNNMPRG
jgi:hypothetical protein